LAASTPRPRASKRGLPSAKRFNSAAAWCRSTIFTTGKKLLPAQPYAIGHKGGGLMALAGLWENWRSPTGERIRSFAIVTTEPNELCARLHNRMPVVLAPEAWPGYGAVPNGSSGRLVARRGRIGQSVKCGMGRETDSATTP
jgi:hypothetical protein